MNPESCQKVKPPSSKSIFWGIQGFALFTILGLIFIVWWKTPAGIDHLSEHLDLPSLLLLVPLLFLDYLIGGFRYSLFFDGKILPKISLWNCMRSNWANIFMGAITPFQTGGGPAQLYILWRNGAKVSQSVLVSLINFSATLTFFQIASLGAIFIIPSSLFSETFTYLMRTGFVVIFLLTGFFINVLIFPRIGYQLMRFIFSLLPLKLLKLYNLRNRLLDGLSMEIQHFQGIFRLILREKKHYLFIIIAATIVLFFNKYIIGYVVAVSLSPGIDFKVFMGLQIVQYFLVYFAPTPGASGLAEMSSTWLMQTIISAEVLVFFAIIYRFLTTILGAIIGGVVLLLDLKEWAKSSQTLSQDNSAVQGYAAVDSISDEN
jgi:uncharacterized protein (TIRG00374 family)